MVDNALSKTIEICNKRGLHARASAKFVQTVAEYEAQIWVEKDSMKVGGDSIMGLMMLGAAPGCYITIYATGLEAEEALTALEVLINERFGETV